MNKFQLRLKSHTKMKALTSYKYNFSNYNYFPTVGVVFIKEKIVARAIALIDSGASISIFHTDIAEKLGITIEDGEKTTLGGVGGRIVGYIHKIKLRIAGKTFTCPIVFSREYKVSFNLLGRDTFFEKFKITFDEAKKNVILA